MLMRKETSAPVAPVEAYVAKHTFADFAIDQRLKRNIADKGYTVPTPIQDQAIPALLEGRDMIGSAQTGTGKTAAFLIPLIQHALTQQTDTVLIIAPTRELAAQIDAEFIEFAKGLNLYSALCIGGTNMGRQIERLRRDPHFVIGTPGRLIDLYNQHALDFARFTSIVLDEVDMMFDMGFIKDMQYIIEHLPSERHSLFFSATMPPKLLNVMSRFVHDPVTVAVKTAKPTADNVNQEVVKLNGRTKIDVLHELLQKDEFEKVLVFGRTKHGAEKLAQMLQNRGLRVAAIHGNKSQNQRTQAIRMFTEDRVSVLVATDVVARGIDISNVTHVINFDLPQTYEDYIHRIGRTGRASSMGTAVTLIE